MAAGRWALRYPAATWRPTDKHGYGNDDNCLGLGIVAHSMEGSLQAAFGEIDRPDRQASWHFSVAKNGDVYQHIETENISYASGSYEANRRFWSIEHEGRAGEPLEPPQRIATTVLMGWLLGIKGSAPVRGTTLREHREMVEFGATATACPSNRIPWDIIIAALQPQEEDFMAALNDQQQAELYNWVYAIKTVLYDTHGVPNGLPRWAWWTLMLQDAAEDDAAIADAKAVANELAARLEQ